MALVQLGIPVYRLEPSMLQITFVAADKPTFLRTEETSKDISVAGWWTCSGELWRIGKSNISHRNPRTLAGYESIMEQFYWHVAFDILAGLQRPYRQ